MKELVVSMPKTAVKPVKVGNTEHLLITGNSLELMKNIPDNSIHLIVTDPPYNIGLDYGPHYKDRKSWDEYYTECRQWLKECARILHDNGSFYLISYPEINARLLPLIENEFKLKFKRWITWHYPTNIGHSTKNFTRSHRSILFFSKGNNYTFNREKVIQPYKNLDVKRIKERMANGSKGRTAYDFLTFNDLMEMKEDIMPDILQINLLKNVSKDRMGNNGKGKGIHHPCQLPLSLLRVLVRVSSNEGDIILDPFAGTFTLSTVAAQLNRNSIGIEINPKFVKLGLKRLKG